MGTIRFKETNYKGNHDESILDTFLRQGVEVPHSCRTGVCNGCKMKLLEGEVRPTSAGSTNSENEDYILSCKNTPVTDIKLELPKEGNTYFNAEIVEKEMLASNICRLRMTQDVFFPYEPGQVINLKFPGDSEFRSYSLASLFSKDEFLELHIKRVPKGKFSNIIFDQVKVGEQVKISMAADVVPPLNYEPDQKVLFIANGTGLAPIQATIKSLLNQNHSGDLILFHGSRDPEGLYMHDELVKLQKEFPNFHYHACVSGSDVPKGYRKGRAHIVAFQDFQELKGFKVYLCGLPQMVSAATVLVTKAGAAHENIHTDSYHVTKHVDQARQVDYELVEEKPFFPEPDPEMWEALTKDDLLNAILKDFYTDVLEDARLGGFFTGVTKDRIMQKQYNFLYQAFTGERVYFGARPRNAHHWMQISDELFDYREDLLFYHARKHGLAEHLVERWRELDEVFRDRMVKSKPWPKIMDGVVYPLEGFEEIVLDASGLCDSCQEEIEAGTRVKYHIRHAEMYCPDCFQSGKTKSA